MVSGGDPSWRICYGFLEPVRHGYPDMSRRIYQEQEHCPVARTLNILGERWTLLIIRDMLAFKKTRFSELLNSLPGLSPNLLSQRLKELEECGIVERQLYNEHPPRMEYRLTPKGKALGPVLQSMRNWGEQYEPLEEESPATSTSSST